MGSDSGYNARSIKGVSSCASHFVGLSGIIRLPASYCITMVWSVDGSSTVSDSRAIQGTLELTGSEI